MSVDFTEPASLGLNLTVDANNDGVMILSIKQGSQAANHPELRPKMILQEVGGKSLRGMSLDQVTSVISEHQERPLRVVFSAGMMRVQLPLLFRFWELASQSR